ncbi:hypothetical protein GCM10020229_21750 [Kitasatospora albolonga]
MPTTTTAALTRSTATESAAPPPDLRLLLPTAVVWAVTATVLGLGPDHRPYLLGGALLLAGAAVLALRSPRRAGALLAAVLLAAGAAAAVTTLHTADLQRGPIPALAARAAGPAATDAPSAPADPGHVPSAAVPPVLTAVELTVTGDPEPRSSHARGTTPGQALVVVEATVDRADGTRTRTPVTLIVRAQDAGGWQQVVPSTRLRTQARVLPAAEGYRSTAAALVVQGRPQLLEGPGTAQRVAARLRAGLRDASDHLPTDARGLLPGLVVGDTTRLPPELAEAFRATDLGHLTAVSGANLAIVLAVLTGASAAASTSGRGGLAGLVGLPLRTTALLGAVLTLAFVTVCRPEPSVLRAAATGLVGLLALATGRPRQALPALASAVLVLLLVDPYLARSFGFLFSVLATLGLLTLGPRWTAALRARGWPEWLAGAVGATAAAQALCAPATILLAPRISLVAIPCNLLAEAAVAPATLLGFATLVLAPLAPAPARFLADLAAVPTGWLAAVARRGAALPGAQLDWPGGLFGSLLLAVATLALVWAARPFGHRSRPRTLLAAVLLPALLLALLRPPSLVRMATGWPPEGWRFVMCDVGQGDMTVLPVPGQPGSAVVVDAGPDPTAADRCLRQLGVTAVPLLILSHYHADHAEGLPGVLRGRSVGALQVTTLDSPPGERARVLAWAAAAQVPVLTARQDERRTAAPGLSWQLLWPVEPLTPATPGANNASIALLATVGEPPEALRIALLGDLEPPAQAALRARAELPRVDVLKVAHHGSAHQDWELAAALHPRLALISCGEGNPYGHPSARTVAQLAALGATVLRTDRAGAVAVLGTRDTLHAVTRGSGAPARGAPVHGTPDSGTPAHGARADGTPAPAHGADGDGSGVQGAAGSPGGAEPLRPHHPQQLQVVDVRGSGRRREDQQSLVLAGCEQCLAVEVDRPDGRVVDPHPAGAPDGHLVQLPELAELLAGLGEPLHQRGRGRVPGPAGHRRPQVGDVHPAEPVVLVGRVGGPDGGVGEPAPDHVPLVLPDRADGAEEGAGHVVLGQHVTQVAEQLGRGLLELVEQVEQPGLDEGAVLAPGRRPLAGQQVEVVALVLAQPQRPGQRGEDLRRGLRAAGLFQPDVVVGGHPGELDDLLAPQPGGAAPGAGRQADVLRVDPLTAAAEEVGEFAAVHVHAVHDRGSADGVPGIPGPTLVGPATAGSEPWSALRRALRRVASPAAPAEGRGPDRVGPERRVPVRRGPVRWGVPRLRPPPASPPGRWPARPGRAAEPGSSRPRGPPRPRPTGRPRRRPRRPGRPGPPRSRPGRASGRRVPRRPRRRRRGRGTQATVGCRSWSRGPLCTAVGMLSAAHAILVGDGQEECTR